MVQSKSSCAGTHTHAHTHTRARTHTHAYKHTQAQEVAAKDGAEREQLRRRLDEKKARVDALCEERAVLTEQLSRVRHSMSMQVCGCG